MGCQPTTTYRVSLDREHSIPFGPTPAVFGLLWCKEIHVLLCRLPQANVLWCIFGGKARTCHETNFREGAIVRDDEEGAVRHVEVSE